MWRHSDNFLSRVVTSKDGLVASSLRAEVVIFLLDFQLILVETKEISLEFVFWLLDEVDSHISNYVYLRMISLVVTSKLPLPYVKYIACF